MHLFLLSIKIQMRTNMEITPSVNPPRNIIKTICKAIFILVLSLLIIFFAAQAVWKMSGSGKWELEIDQQGVKVYSLKAPGSSLKKIKGVTRVKSSLSGLVSFFQDQSVCPEFGCLTATVFERVNSQLYYNEFQYPLPGPFKPREFVVKSLFYQVPETKEIHYTYAAVPEKLPENDCCVRLTHFYVFWRFIPLGNGEVEVEFIRDFDLGGFMPDVLINLELANGSYSVLSRLQSFLDRGKYKQDKFDFVTEVE